MGYPIKLKKAVLKKVLEGNKPRHEIAKEFGIGKSTISKWLKEYKMIQAKILMVDFVLLPGVINTDEYNKYHKPGTGPH